MVTMLDCIKRVPSILDGILENRADTFRALWETYGAQTKEIDEILIVGSGTSFTSAATARYLAEEASGVRVTVSPPNEFLYSLSARNANALYVFVSQTGTSTITRDALRFCNEKGFRTAAISEAATTPIASEAKVFINMRCGKEEYGMRTIGYSASVLTMMLLGVELGLQRGHITQAQYDAYIAQAKKAAGNVNHVIEKSETWMDTSRRGFLRSDCIALTGAGALYGVAMEGAVKLWETPQIVAAGYEMDEGIHGPNFGYNHNHAVVVLNDGGRDNDTALGLARYMKNEWQNGYIIGANAIDENDVSFQPQGGPFQCLEFAAAVQVLAYRLAVDSGRDLVNRRPANSPASRMHTYFSSHFKPEEPKEKKK